MTRYEVELREVLLAGLPRGYGDDLGRLVEERLAALAAGAMPAGAFERRRPGPAGDAGGVGSRGRTADRQAADGPGAVADVLANRIWAAVRDAQRGPAR